MTELEMFAKFPQLNENCEKTNIGSVPSIISTGYISVPYVVYWMKKDTCKSPNKYFIGDTPEEAIRKAYEWCDSNNLL
jgi:hypothetical protein